MLRVESLSLTVKLLLYLLMVDTLNKMFEEICPDNTKNFNLLHLLDPELEPFLARVLLKGQLALNTLYLSILRHKPVLEMI